MSAHAVPQRLTLYSGDYEAVSQSDVGAGGPGYALVERPLRVDAGANGGAFALDDLPRAIDPSTAILSGAGLRVRGQRYDFAGLDQGQLLERAIGHEINVEQSVGNELRRYSGTLLSASNGLTLRESNGTVRVLSNFSAFTLASPPRGLVVRPTLRFQLAAERSGEQDATLAFTTAGLAWRAEYRAVLSKQGGACRMALEGHAMVANRSGADFLDTRLTLVAGEPNRVSSGGPRVFMAMAAPPAESKVMSADAAPSPEASSEYHSYTLPQAGDLPDGSLQRLPLVNLAEGVPCMRRYSVQNPSGDWMPDRPMVQRQIGGDGESEVRTRLEFKNEKSQGLGAPLPAGRVRVFDGSALLGEASLGHTATGREVALDLGRSFDLSAARKSTAFSVDRDGRTMTETVEWTLRNGKSEPAVVRIGDRLPRWTDWALLEGADAFSKQDAQRIQADITIAANAETTVRYTVRYRWAEDVTID
jgi:hypothetical protein